MIQILTDDKTKTGSIYATGDAKHIGLELNLLLNNLYNSYPYAILASINVFLEEKLNS